MKLMTWFVFLVLYILFITALTLIADVNTIITDSGYTTTSIYGAAYLVGIVGMTFLYIVDAGKR